MSTFQGFNITGIDRDRSPVFKDGKILYNQIHFVLEPIDAPPRVEDFIVWKFSFRSAIEDWENYPEFNRYKQGVTEVPQLEFILDSNEAFISACGESFQSLVNCISFIQDLVKWTNKRVIRNIEDINRFREDIDQTNSRYFGN